MAISSLIAMYAPVVVFCYRRSRHLRQTLESLMCCDGIDQTSIIVFGDGPKADSDLAEVAETRKVAIDVLGSRAEYHFQAQNIGLSSSIISGVSAVLGRFDRVIVIEDDLKLAPTFLTYMNLCLEKYKDAPDVYQVSGYMFNVPDLASSPNAILLPFTVSWGWATWRRAWIQFDTSAAGWQELLSNASMRYNFNLEGAYDYASMLIKQMSGELDSWAIRWYWSVFKSNGLVIFPPVSLVSNIGFDGSGSHGRGRLRDFNSACLHESTALPNLPDCILTDSCLSTQVYSAIKRSNGGLIGSFISFLIRLKHYSFH